MSAHQENRINDCPRLEPLNVWQRAAALDKMSCIACCGPNAVTAYNPGRRDNDGDLRPQHRAICCQEPIQLRADEQIIDQRTSEAGGGQLWLKVISGDIGRDVLRVTHFLDDPDPIPLGTVMLNGQGNQVQGTEFQHIPSLHG